MYLALQVLENHVYDYEKVRFSQDINISAF